ncbi:MAG: hypothetical protein IIZ45_05870, partial [Firmicutes bacterium]|nr:hypothetical protein [Bacillota bacterium]
MGFNDDFKRYLLMRKSGRYARFNESKRTQTNRRIIARFTCGKTIPAALAAFVTQLTASASSREQLDQTIRAYATADQLADKRWLRRIKRDVYFTQYYHRISPNEYFRYKFEYLSKKGRHQYVGKAELSRLRKLGNPRLTNDKYESYVAFRPYYKRDAVLIGSREDEALFNDFCDRHPVFFLKPLSDCGGHGVQRIDLEGMDKREDVFDHILQRTSACIPEEPIIQAEAMAKYHPDSINTVRVVVLKKDDTLEVLQTSVRFGRGGAVVDNTGTGGLSSSVDTETGLITSPGRVGYEYGVFLRHPDTGVQILGSQIPAW